jgi:hypothetical protein
MSGETLISNISELPHDIVNTKDFRETLDKNLANYQVFYLIKLAFLTIVSVLLMYFKRQFLSKIIMVMSHI